MNGVYLEHIRESFRYAMRRRGTDMALPDLQVVLTVPASFDDIARNLTAEAAEAAGFGKVILLEEPLAAFYAWTAQAGKEWRAQICPRDIVLVCDVGGGTADFSLIAISEKEGILDLNRISVGEHILLGGGNMDLALAYTLRAKLEAGGKSIGEMQFLALTHAACNAKVAMFEDEALAEFPIAVPSRGSSRSANRLDETRPANARTGHPRRLLRQDRDRGSAAEGAAGGLAGIRAALHDRSRHQQASRPLSHAQPRKRAGE